MGGPHDRGYDDRPVLRNVATGRARGSALSPAAGAIVAHTCTSHTGYPPVPCAGLCALPRCYCCAARCGSPAYHLRCGGRVWMELCTVAACGLALRALRQPFTTTMSTTCLFNCLAASDSRWCRRSTTTNCTCTRRSIQAGGNVRGVLQYSAVRTRGQGTVTLCGTFVWVTVYSVAQVARPPRRGSQYFPEFDDVPAFSVRVVVHRVVLLSDVPLPNTHTHAHAHARLFRSSYHPVMFCTSRRFGFTTWRLWTRLFRSVSCCIAARMSRPHNPPCFTIARS